MYRLVPFPVQKRCSKCIHFHFYTEIWSPFLSTWCSFFLHLHFDVYNWNFAYPEGTGIVSNSCPDILVGDFSYPKVLKSSPITTYSLRFRDFSYQNGARIISTFISTNRIGDFFLSKWCSHCLHLHFHIIGWSLFISKRCSQYLHPHFQSLIGEALTQMSELCLPSFS